ncbi:ankyrin repeat protein [Acanthamoeba polyphaga mimivirus]|uniref:Ankyrin repeat protein n=2 Tax=Megamimivirinae TaxID=3044648 RepID=A0A2L2DK40_MIMIV|nr:putative ankyrin repeat protein [Megavirus lba]AVG46514.1 ankyrin repeat protein [Acanthamoeba polyphaga mimivirus]
MQHQLLPNFKPLIYVNNDINHYDSMLSIIFKCNNLEVAEKILVEKKIDLEKNADILCDCVKNGTLEMFILLIKYGAKITSKSQRADLSNKKYPVIWTICNIGRLDIMMHIFKQKYDKKFNDGINSQELFDFDTEMDDKIYDELKNEYDNDFKEEFTEGFIEACYQGHLSIVELFLSYGFDINTTNGLALAKAINNNKFDIILLLMTNGINLSNVKSYKPVSNMTKSRYIIYQMLLDGGLDPIVLLDLLSKNE